MIDAINPSHYKDHPSGIECIEIARYLGFDLGNAFKYLWRAGKKDGNSTIQDLEKAQWYIVDSLKNPEATGVVSFDMIKKLRGLLLGNMANNVSNIELSCMCAVVHGAVSLSFTDRDSSKRRALEIVMTLKFKAKSAIPENNQSAE